MEQKIMRRVCFWSRISNFQIAYNIRCVYNGYDHNIIVPLRQTIPIKPEKDPLEVLQRIFRFDRKLKFVKV